MAFKIGDIVRVTPHTVERHLSRGAVISPPRIGQRRGWPRAEVTGFGEDGSVEVRPLIGRGDQYDYVPESALEKLA